MGAVHWVFISLLGLCCGEIAVVELGFQCPKNFPCTCETWKENGDSMNVVNCTGRGLRRLPDFSKINMEDTISIDLSNNSLRAVPKGHFKGLKINWVKFNSNPIKKIHEKAFDGVTGINAILCKNCSLPGIPKVFKYTEGLEILNLEKNNISKIEPGAFKDTTLKELYIGDNVLYPAPRMFEDLADTLERISFYRLFLWRIPITTIAKLKNLRRVDLHYNQISSIKKSDINKLPTNISHLDFSHNPVEKIEFGSFEQFVNNRDGITINFTQSKITKVNFIQDACRMTGVFMPLKGAPLHCDCTLYNITRNHVLNTSGFCKTPEKFRWYSIYGDTSFVSETYEDEYEACPDVWKLPCTGAVHRSLPSIIIGAVIAFHILKN